MKFAYGTCMDPTFPLRAQAVHLCAFKLPSQGLRPVTLEGHWYPGVYRHCLGAPSSLLQLVVMSVLLLGTLVVFFGRNDKSYSLCTHGTWMRSRIQYSLEICKFCIRIMRFWCRGFWGYEPGAQIEPLLL